MNPTATTTSKPTLGLKERIAQASTIPDVHTLLAEGAGYQHASPSTRRQWERVAAKRLVALRP